MRGCEDDDVSDDLMPAVARLIAASFDAWRLQGDVKRSDAEICVTAGEVALRISRAPPGMPFRWVVSISGRKRTAASVVGVLRIVRQTVAPGYEPLRLRIASLPATPRGLPS